MTTIKIIKPHPGKQDDYVSCSADIALYGGAPGGGKTYGSLFIPLIHCHDPNFRMIYFRKTMKQIEQLGGLWDKSKDFYRHIQGLEYNDTRHRITFPSGAIIQFASLHEEKAKNDHQSAQYDVVVFEELTGDISDTENKEGFTITTVFFLLSRLRSENSSVIPYMRWTCNPNPDHWVKGMLLSGRWINEDGDPVEAMSGVVRYFVRDEKGFLWYDSVELALVAHPHLKPIHIKSFTFINSNLYDNYSLMENNPEYEGNILAQDPSEQKRLLGNWNSRANKGTIFKRERFIRVPKDQQQEFLDDLVLCCRFWDRAATEPNPDNTDPDHTAGVLMGFTRSLKVCIINVDRFRHHSSEVKKRIASNTKQDSIRFKDDYIVGIEEPPADAGISDTDTYKDLLYGFTVEALPAKKSKEMRARPFSEEVDEGNVYVFDDNPWIEAYLNELSAFPGGKKNDQVDGSSGGFLVLRPLLRHFREMER